MPYFDIGDKAIVIDGIDNKCRALLYEIVTITSPLLPGTHEHFPGSWEFYLVNDEKIAYDAAGNGHSHIAFRPQDLRPYYDGIEKGSWDDCEFKAPWLKVEVTV